MSRASLAELEAVALVARRGGFRAAARDLGVSSSALSHSISALEARIGVRLFNRTTRSVVLTAAGEQFVAEIGPALAAIDQAIHKVGELESEPRGVLRLNMALGAARMLLDPLLLEYLRRHPAMSLEIATDNALVDVIGEGFDAGVRVSGTVPPDMIAVTMIPRLRLVVVGSPALFAMHAPPTAPADLARLPCVRARMATGRIYHWEFTRRGESIALDVPGPLILDDSGLMLEAALSGVGLAYLPEPAVKEHLAAGRLVEVLADWTPPYGDLCLYYPGRRQVPAKLRALIDLVRETRAQ